MPVILGYLEDKFVCPLPVAALAAAGQSWMSFHLWFTRIRLKRPQGFELTMNRDSHIRLEIFKQCRYAD